MTFKPVYLSLLLVLTMLFYLGCEPEGKVHVLSDPADKPVEAKAQAQPEQAQAEAIAEAEAPAATEVITPVKPEQMQEVVEAVEPVAGPSPNDVAVTVDGVEVTESKLEEMMKPQLDMMLARSKGRAQPPNFLENAKKRLRGQVLEGAVINQLVEQDLVKQNIVITEEQINEYIKGMAKQQNMSLDDLKSLVESNGRTYEDWKKQMQFDKRIAVEQLVEKRGLGTLDVDEAEALDYYNQNQKRYESPEQVKASHVLIKPDTSDPNTDPNAADALALEKAQALLEQIKNGADFAELAKANSACPSGKNGGDLGFGQRRSWVGPFSDAAFALQPGEISDVVKTQFGYHIIKTTERKEAGLQSFDEVKKDVTNMLRTQKQQKLMMQYFDLLKSEAIIVYPSGKEPQKMTPPMR